MRQHLNFNFKGDGSGDLQGGKVTFPDFFPAWNALFPGRNFHFGPPQTHFSGFKKWQAKNKTKQKQKQKQNKNKNKNKTTTTTTTTTKQKKQKKKKKKEKKKKGPLLIFMPSFPLQIYIFLLPFYNFTSFFSSPFSFFSFPLLPG